MDTNKLPNKYRIFRDGRLYKKSGYDHSARNGCCGKRKFKNLSAAENHIMKKFPEDFELLPYKCRYCRKYHVGHPRKKH